jgi:hypothetical protein
VEDLLELVLDHIGATTITKKPVMDLRSSETMFTQTVIRICVQALCGVSVKVRSGRILLFFVLPFLVLPRLTFYRSAYHHKHSTYWKSNCCLD